MTRTSLLALIAGLAALGAAQTASAEAVARQGSTRAGVTLCENACLHYTLDDGQVADWRFAPVLSGLKAKEEGSFEDGFFVHKDTNATWASANHGHLSETTEAFATQPVADFLGFVNSADSPSVERTEDYDLRYNFQATADGQLTVSGTLDRLGAKVTELGAWAVGLVADDPANLKNFGAHDIKTISTAFEGDTEHRGSVTFDLKKGQTYSFAIFNDEGAGPFEGGVEPETDHGLNFIETGEFDWTITENAPGNGGGGGGGGGGGAVPEPASWALMILGLGAAGAQLRRRVVLARA